MPPLGYGNGNPDLQDMPDAWGDTPTRMRVAVGIDVSNRPRLLHNDMSAAGPLARNDASVPQPATTGAPHVDSIEAIRALVECDGNSGMAAIRLGTTEAVLLAAIVTDETSHEIMARYLRAFSTMKVFALVTEVHGAIAEAVRKDQIAARDLVKLSSGLLENLSKLTDARHTVLTRPGGPGGNAAGSANAAEQLYRTLPEHVQQAVRVLIEDSVRGDADVLVHTPPPVYADPVVLPVTDRTMSEAARPNTGRGI